MEVSLGLNSNTISDLSPVSSLSSLKKLLIKNNLITDIAQVISVPALCGIALEGNPLSEASLNQYAPALQKKKVVVDFLVTLM